MFNSKEKALMDWCLKFLQNKLEDHFELYPPAMNAAGVGNGNELEQMLKEMRAKLQAK